MNISPQIMKEVFDISKNATYEWRCGNYLSRSSIHYLHFGIDFIANIAAKIWNTKIKEASYLTIFKSKIIKWV